MWTPARRQQTIHSETDSRIWMLVMGSSLLDQIVVSAFGEPGFSAFVESIARPDTEIGSAPASLDTDTAHVLLTSLQEELDARPAAYRARARSLLLDLLLILYRGTCSAEPRQEDGHRLAAVIDSIEQRFDEQLELDALAELAGTSPTHLSRVFSRTVGMPLFEFVNRTRIREACRLLAGSSFSITQIAMDVGYNNVSFFNRYFRRIMRCSPSEYRRTTQR